MHTHHADLITPLARPEVLELPLYDAGVTDTFVRERYGVQHVARLATNENPLGASDAVRHVLADAAARTGLYPDPDCSELRRQIAARTGVATERIAVGNGSENLLETLCQAFLTAGDEVLTLAPSFGLHEIYPRMMGARVRKVAVNAQLEFDIEAWERELRSPCKLVLLSNPSNPVGCILDQTAFSRLLHATGKDALLIIDEAYFEYAVRHTAFPDALQLLAQQSRPWLVLRTFSKAYGLAGLRVGYALASDRRIIQLIDRVRTPYNVNSFAQQAAIASLQDLQHLESGVTLVTRERERLATRLRAAGFTVAPSHANFLFIDVRTDSRSVARQLLELGVLVKPWREPGYEHFVRASIGTARDNDTFFSALVASSGPPHTKE